MHSGNVLCPKERRKTLVIDCRHVNTFMSAPSFSQEGINSVADLIESEDDLVTIDLKDGFHHVPVHSRHVKNM